MVNREEKVMGLYISYRQLLTIYHIRVATKKKKKKEL